MFYTLLQAAGTAQGAAEGTGTGVGAGSGLMWISLLVMVVIFYFMIIRPQKKQQKEQEEMMAQLKPGVSIMTTSGFYGVVLDVVEDTVIVEFGNNKNCRIPMNKAAVAKIDRPEEDTPDENAEEEEKTDKEKKDKKLSLGKKKED